MHLLVGYTSDQWFKSFSQIINHSMSFDYNRGSKVMKTLNWRILLTEIKKTVECLNQNTATKWNRTFTAVYSIISECTAIICKHMLLQTVPPSHESTGEFFMDPLQMCQRIWNTDKLICSTSVALSTGKSNSITQWQLQYCSKALQVVRGTIFFTPHSMEVLEAWVCSENFAASCLTD